MWPIYLLALIPVVYYAVYSYLTRNLNYWQTQNVVGPKPTGILNSMRDVVLRKKNIALVYQELYDAYPKEKVVGFYRMTTPCLLIRDLDIIKNIMIKDFSSFSDRGVEFSTKGLGQNLFHSDGEAWKALRNKFTPIFTSGKLKNMFYLLSDRSDQFIDYIQKQNDTEHDVRSLVEKYTVSTISACAFGLDVDTLNSDIETLTYLNKTILTPNLFFDLDMMFPGLLRKLNLSIFPTKVQKFFSDLVSQVTKQRNNKPTDRNDFMDLILQLRQQGEISYAKSETEQHVLEVTDDIIAAQAFVFYVAGYETSATTVSFLLHELAMRPAIQDKLIKEIDTVLQANDGKITYESIKEINYLDKVFDETLRMHSIVDPLQRVALHDYKIPNSDIVIKKGQLVFISGRGIHADEQYYPNPEVFDPERFAPDLVGARHSCAYLPFGVGPRNCIGARFGKLQSRLCVVKLLSKFRLEPSAKTEKKLKIDANRVIVGPDGGVYLNLVPRL